MASEPLITDPKGRYVRSSEELGRGAYKVVYKAIDRDLGLEVAWNQIRLEQGTDFDKLWKEINILEQLKHPNIIVFHHSWVDEEKLQVIFITEYMTSGTLKQFIKKAQGVRLKVIKNWCLQILDGLNYLHTRDPPIIHRDIKCDNIFINGSLGQVKIGDLGLATILNQSGAMMKQSIIGTPEFMAPEYYEEKYDEKVDIWAFGMTVLEMTTMDYPFCECDNPAQIFKKVSTGQKPRSLARIADPEVYTFIDDCLQAIEHRMSASELLKHPFLQNIDDEGNNRVIDMRSDADTDAWLELMKKDAVPFEFRPSWQKIAMSPPARPGSGIAPVAGVAPPSSQPLPAVSAQPVFYPQAQAGVGVTPAAPAAAVSTHVGGPASSPAPAPSSHATLVAGGAVVVANPDDFEEEDEEEEEFDFDGEDFEEDDDYDEDDDEVALSHTAPPIMPVGGPSSHYMHHMNHAPMAGQSQPSHQHHMQIMQTAQPHTSATTPVARPAGVTPATSQGASAGAAGMPVTQMVPQTPVMVPPQPAVTAIHAQLSTPSPADETISLKIDAGWTPVAGAPQVQPAPSDPNAVNLKCSLMIGQQVTVIEFEYNIQKDTPVQVAAEMVRELQLAESCVPDIAAYLEAKVTEYIVQSKILAPLPPADERLRTRREQIMSQGANEPLRLSSPGRPQPSSRTTAQDHIIAQQQQQIAMLQQQQLLLQQQQQQQQLHFAGIRRTQSTGQRRRRVTESGAPASLPPGTGSAAGRPPKPARADSTAELPRHVRKKSRSKIPGLMRKSQSQADVGMSDTTVYSHGADVVHTAQSPAETHAFTPDAEGHDQPVHQDSSKHLEELQDFKKLVESNNANFENALAAFDESVAHLAEHAPEDHEAVHPPIDLPAGAEHPK